MNLPNQPLGQPGAASLPGIQPSSSGSKARPNDVTRDASDASPAFQVLLERLQKKAESLEATSKVLDDPKALAGAVDIARASLDDALSLSDRLLEAYREARTQDLLPNSNSNPENPS
ncbi:MAG TPA: hypothetical protein ENJ09_06565 [Planctomycetes bacterium]|nr:hypothetical protein [Planctomycetota bacterium]